MRRIISFIIIVTVCSLMGIMSTIPALAHEAVQDSYLPPRPPMGLSRQLPIFELPAVHGDC
jgi:hypothetical protein